MSIWLFRAGKNGEYLLQTLQNIYSSEKRNTLRNWASQIYPIAFHMEIDDWIVLPSKRKSTIHFGKIPGS